MQPSRKLLKGQIKLRQIIPLINLQVNSLNQTGKGRTVLCFQASESEIFENRNV